MIRKMVRPKAEALRELLGKSPSLPYEYAKPMKKLKMKEAKKKTRRSIASIRMGPGPQE